MPKAEILQPHKNMEHQETEHYEIETSAKINNTYLWPQSLIWPNLPMDVVMVPVNPFSLKIINYGSCSVSVFYCVNNSIKIGSNECVTTVTRGKEILDEDCLRRK